MKLACSISFAVAGACQRCGKYQRDAMHLLDGRALCGDCCPEHRVSHEWKERAPEKEPVQQSMFSKVEEYPG